MCWFIFDQDLAQQLHERYRCRQFIFGWFRLGRLRLGWFDNCHWSSAATSLFFVDGILAGKLTQEIIQLCVHMNR
ncbi:MAG: hypothetical protein AMJ75_07220 [Phycisphaerae bacterium SM1_79]|nr:MAG: hypothetical protein AMJ75_07220 [Phycisphaerae bacterium SM1_79]